MTRADGDKSIFITGAASGIGHETALLFADKGWFVGGYDVNAAGLDTLSDAIGAENGLFKTLDVTDLAAFEAAIARFGEATGGTLDLLHNNAGIIGGGLLDEQPWDEVLRVVGINFLGVMIGVRAGIKLLRATPGSLCLTTSSSAIFGTAGNGAYTATKHAVRGLTEALSIELKRYGTRAADLLPGLIDMLLMSDTMGRAAHALEHLEEWTEPSPRHIDPAILGTARAEVRYQLKGVIGSMVPWDLPFDLSAGPMVDMLAAGNRVIVKPSEYTPACAAMLAEMVAAAFDPDLVTVAIGGLDLARAFAAMPWDHLLYTGSPNVGRQVMAAAANLTPVTLELGGKCPAILTAGSVTERNVESVIGTKIIKNGQMCVSVDYALVPRGELEAFVGHAQAFIASTAPDYARSDSCTGIISARHLARLTDMLEEARDRQALVVTLGDRAEPDAATRRMPISLVVDPPADLRICQEEIFGPILPVIPYDDLDDAVERINAGERPLGLYVFGDDPAITDYVLATTHSGGAAVNTCAAQSSLPSMGFGGSGMSGIGRHHGVEGFREFSNQRGLVIRGEGDMIDAFYSHEKGAAVVQAVVAPNGTRLFRVVYPFNTGMLGGHHESGMVREVSGRERTSGTAAWWVRRGSNPGPLD